MEMDKKEQFMVLDKDVLIKMWEGAEKSADLLNALCMKSANNGKPLFGAEARIFIRSLKEATKINREALQTFLRFGRVDVVEADKTGKPVMIRLNN